MTLSRAPYMEWAKARPRPAVDLAGSNLHACTLDDLPGAREAVDIAGESPEGYPPLLEEIARRYDVTAERVATAGGCSGANFLACAAVLDTGDEVLVESPFYDPLPAAARMLGATISTFARRFEDGYDLDPDAIAAAVTQRTRLLILSNPHNPSGTTASPERLIAVARLAEKRGFLILVDEVYRDTLLEDRPPLAAALSEACIGTNSLTKAYGLAGLRCGWTIASAPLTRRIRRARDLVDNWAPMPSDRLSVVAFRNLDRLAARARALIDANLRQVKCFLAATPGLECVPPRATLAFPRLRGASDSRAFTERLLRETGTAVAPGHFFGAPAHFRMAFGGLPSVVTAGLDSITRCLDGA
jgi:aspartate/methionine/tyrosine aminotransferase